MRLLSSLIGVGLLLAAGTPYAGQGFIDPLAVTAQPAAHARHSPLTAITAAGTRLVAVGWRGLIVYSDDNGKSWQQGHVPVSVDLTAVAFPTEKEGWAAGHDGIILHSSDGGASWTVQLNGTRAAATAVTYYQKKLDAGDQSVRGLLDDAKTHQTENASNPFLSIYFVSPTEGFAVGSFGLAMHTRDAGKTWQPFADSLENADDQHLFGMDGHNGDLYIASEKGIVFVRQHGTDHFVRRQTGYGGSLFGVVASASGAVAYGLRGNAFHTSDAGATWQSMGGRDGATITGGTSFPDGRIVLVDLGGSVMESDPNLISLKPVGVTPRLALSGVASGKGGQVTVVGINGVDTLAER